MGRPCRQNAWLLTTKAGIVWKTPSRQVAFWGRRNVSKTCIIDGHEVYLRLSKDEQQQIQWPRTIAILREVLTQVSVYLYRLNYTDVNSTALSINKTGGVKGTCKKANPYYIGLAGNDTLQKFRITFTANGRLTDLHHAGDQIQSLLRHSNRFHFSFIHMTYFQHFFFADIPNLKLELST